jgi:hypothetical protein
LSEITLFDELGRPVRRTAAIVRHIELQKTASLAAGAAEHDSYTVPAGRSWVGGRIRFECDSLPPGATAGHHWVRGLTLGAFTDLHLLQSNATSTGMWIESEILGAAMASGRVLRLFYGNSTNAAQTIPRRWHVVLAEEVS